MANDFRVGDLVTVKHQYVSHPGVGVGSILMLMREGADTEVWHAYKFLKHDEVVYVHFNALKLYWRPDAGDPERLPDTGS